MSLRFKPPAFEGRESEADSPSMRLRQCEALLAPLARRSLDQQEWKAKVDRVAGNAQSLLDHVEGDIGDLLILLLFLIAAIRTSFPDYLREHPAEKP